MKSNFSKTVCFVFLLMLLVTILSSCSQVVGGKTISKETFDAKSVLDSADKIRIREQAINLSKAYDIFVGKDKVGTVQGHILKDFGDKFTLTTVNGEVLAKEKQIKRKFRFSVNRLAEVYDADDNVTGYIAENRIKDMFNAGYTFHFYDKDENELGVSDQVFWSWTKKNNFYDMNEELDYKVTKKINMVSPDDYFIEVEDKNSDIPLYNAILMVCIEAAIESSESESD